MISKILWLTGSAIFFVLGILHVYYIFFTKKIYPRNKDVVEMMKGTQPVLTRETSVWKAWIGFNASHGAGAVFIGLVNSVLAANYFSVLEGSFAISFITIVASVFYLWLAKRYWFSVPFYGLLIASCCFIAAPVASFFS